MPNSWEFVFSSVGTPLGNVSFLAWKQRFEIVRFRGPNLSFLLGFGFAVYPYRPRLHCCDFIGLGFNIPASPLSPGLATVTSEASPVTLSWPRKKLRFRPRHCHLLGLACNSQASPLSPDRLRLQHSGLATVTRPRHCHLLGLTSDSVMATKEAKVWTAQTHYFKSLFLNPENKRFQTTFRHPPKNLAMRDTTLFLFGAKKFCTDGSWI